MQIIVEPCPNNTQETFQNPSCEKAAAVTTLEHILRSEAVDAYTGGSEEIIITLDGANSDLEKLAHALYHLSPTTVRFGDSRSSICGTLQNKVESANA